MLEMLWLILFIVVMITILFSPYDDSNIKRRFIGCVRFTTLDDEKNRHLNLSDNPYLYSISYATLERSHRYLWCNGWSYKMTDEERRMTDEQLEHLAQDIFS